MGFTKWECNGRWLLNEWCLARNIRALSHLTGGVRRSGMWGDVTVQSWALSFHVSGPTWWRLPELPIEFFEQKALKDIGQAIGPVLRIDTHTAAESRGRFARICVQINLDNPLIRTIMIGRLTLYSYIWSCGVPYVRTHFPFHYVFLQPKKKKPYIHLPLLIF